jgi:ribosomal protein L11 methyltransferase
MPSAQVNTLSHFEAAGKERMDLKRELQKVLQKVGPGSIWRPVYDLEGNLLASGTGWKNDGLPEDFPKDHFRGKTVLDLGCNIGFYTFLAKKQGASKAVGIDINEQLIKGCNILKAMYGMSDIHFYVADVLTYDPPVKYDIAMLLDTIGKNLAQTGLLKNFLDALERLARYSMIISFRTTYRIPKHFDVNAEKLAATYSSAYIRNDRFHLLEYVQARFKNNWETAFLSRDNGSEADNKRTLLFVRKRIRT